MTAKKHPQSDRNNATLGKSSSAKPPLSTATNTNQIKPNVVRARFVQGTKRGVVREEEVSSLILSNEKEQHKNISVRLNADMQRVLDYLKFSLGVTEAQVIRDCIRLTAAIVLEAKKGNPFQLIVGGHPVDALSHLKIKIHDAALCSK